MAAAPLGPQNAASRTPTRPISLRLPSLLCPPWAGLWQCRQAFVPSPLPPLPPAPAQALAVTAGPHLSAALPLGPLSRTALFPSSFRAVHSFPRRPAASWCLQIFFMSFMHGPKRSRFLHFPSYPGFPPAQLPPLLLPRLPCNAAARRHMVRCDVHAIPAGGHGLLVCTRKRTATASSHCTSLASHEA